MPPKQMSQAAIAKLVADEVAKALAADRATRNTTGVGGSGNVGGVGNAGGPEIAQPAMDCTFSSFVKCGPTQFHGKEGAIELCRWFENIECTFGISECAERNKVKFIVATLQGRALTWVGMKEMLSKTRGNGKVEIKEIIKGGNAPKCNRCNMFHFGNCPVKCNKCGKKGHFARDCHGKGVATGANAEPIRACFKFGTRIILLIVICDSRGRSKVARKYIERGCHLFLAHVTEKEKSEKRLEDIPVIRDFPEVFPDNLMGLPPP
ncbi:putative reverse transcriptase domain-containing protein [Tanacetum coccineum]